MRRFVLSTAVITAIMLSGCAKAGINETTVIGGSDGPATIYLAPKVEKETITYSDTKDEESTDGTEEFFAGTWVTASQGYEYYGTTQPMYYVRFEGMDIIYGHMKDGEFIPEHTDTSSLIEQLPGGGYIVKAKTETGGKYTYRSEEGDRDVLNYYETWDEDEFSSQYRGGASLGRTSDKAVKNKFEGDFETYYEMDDGTWMCKGKSYKYRLEITGRLNNAAKDSTFIYLSNIEDISFDRAAMASGLSSNMADYFSPEEAVFIGWKE